MQQINVMELHYLFALVLQQTRTHVDCANYRSYRRSLLCANGVLRSKDVRHALRHPLSTSDICTTGCCDRDDDSLKAQSYTRGNR